MDVVNIIIGNRGQPQFVRSEYDTVECDDHIRAQIGHPCLSAELC